MGHAEFARNFFFTVIEINADDDICACHAQALNDVQADAAKAKNGGG